MKNPVFSVIIPTIQRASLSRAVESVLAQKTDAGYEVVVVNDSGNPLTAAWQAVRPVRVMDTPRVERSEARNAGASSAKGDYLLFLDDDDWLLPTALESFYNHIRLKAAPWLVADCELVARNGARLATIQPDCAGNCSVQTTCGEVLPMHAICMRRDLFFAIGGFAPLTLGEDRELAMRLALHADAARVDAVVGAIEYERVPTTSHYTRAQTERFWQARDRILDQPHTFARLRASAQDSYWSGRMVRLYVNSFLLQLKCRQLLTAVARARYAGRALYTRHALGDPMSFWRGITRTHSSRVIV